MSQKLSQLKSLLRELFQLDQPDLDFGIYRVLHARSDEVTQFLENDLLPQVRAAFAQYQSADKAEILRALDLAIQQARALGADPDSLPKVRELRARLAHEAVDVAQLENEVYDHLLGFFRRYYSEGDFLARRVYKPGVYAIPYEGEEVTLHWANKDQYYIKTSEHLRDYAFRLRPAEARHPMRVHFRLADAAEGEHGNAKAAEGKDRVFILSLPSPDADFITQQPGPDGPELVIRFEYRPATLHDTHPGALPGSIPQPDPKAHGKPPTQKDLLAIATQRILALPVSHPVTQSGWTSELSKPHTLANGQHADYSRLEAHLRRYAARNTFDYFIHKDLGAFLRRELDFYVKNEVLHLDDVENEAAPRVEQYLSKIKVLRKIAGKIIAFLASIEDFQKKLWLKKKFVVESHYCIALGAIPESFYPEIAANHAQHEEWVRLYAIDELKPNPGSLLEPAKPGYSVPLTPEFLKVHPTLVLDTRLFVPAFADRLLEGMGETGNRADGELFQSDNFQALMLLRERYRAKVDCIYVDPPYNTGEGDFPYKDSYRTSSWLSMMSDRVSLGRELLLPAGSFIAHIDEHEFRVLETLGSQIFGSDNNIGPVVWDKRNPKGDARGIAGQHEYLTWLIKDSAVLATDDARMRRPKENAQQILDKASELIRQHGGVNSQSRVAFREWLRQQPFSGGELAYNQLDNAGDVFRTVSMAWPNKSTAPNDYFKPLVHPLTNKPCPVPERGWRNSPATMQRLIDEKMILFGVDETTQPTRKYLLRENMHESVPSLYYFGGSDDELQKNFGFIFPNPKPARLARYVTNIALGKGDRCLDFFAGSGTVGHAIINLNREDGGNRKFVLVEMGNCFDSVLLPRLMKVIYSPEWKDGKPRRLATREEAERGPRVIKVIRLESYEDTLNNLEVRRSPEQQLVLSSQEAGGAGGLREEYLLRYMLNVETRGSQSLLNVQAFRDPTAYKLKVKRPGSDESRETSVDLLETFNWLVGLTVRHIAAPRSFAAGFERDVEGRLRIQGRLRQDEGGTHWFRTVTGTTPDGRRALVIWRNLPGDAEQDNLVLDEWFTKQGYSSKDGEFDVIWVNGGNNLENLKTPDDRWKVRLIEEDFHRLMFETEDV